VPLESTKRLVSLRNTAPHSTFFRTTKKIHISGHFKLQYYGYQTIRTSKYAVWNAVVIITVNYIPKNYQKLGSKEGIRFRVRLKLFVGFWVMGLALGLGTGFMIRVLCSGKFSVRF